MNDVEKIILNYQRAFELANNKKAPVMFYQKGWYYIDTDNYRERSIIEMTARLNARINKVK